MASTNIYTKFKELTSTKPQIRAEVLAYDSASNRSRVTYTGFTEWVTGESTLGDFVLISDGVLLSVLPELPYQQTEI